jgi:hypothetical protein
MSWPFFFATFVSNVLAVFLTTLVSIVLVFFATPDSNVLSSFSLHPINGRAKLPFLFCKNAAHA